MAHGEVKDIPLECINESGKPNGTLVVFDPNTGKILYWIIREEKNVFALWREPMDDDPIARFTSADAAKRWAHGVEEHVAELVDTLQEYVKSDPATQSCAAGQDLASTGESPNEACACACACGSRKRSSWDWFRRFITGESL